MLYGAVMRETAAGPTVDAAATWRNRDDLRARLVPGKRGWFATLAAAAAVADGVRAGGRQWSCGYCGTGLGPVGEPWRTRAVARGNPLADVFEASETQIRRRRDQPVELNEYHCPACAVRLSVDIGVDAAAREPPGFAFRDAAV